MKSWSEAEYALPGGPRRRQYRYKVIVPVVAAAFVLLPFTTKRAGVAFPWLHSRPSAEPHHDPRPFEWSAIEPTESLKFHSCYDGFECAKLKVPLDHFNGTFPDEYVSIAIAKLPAKVPVDDPRYGGPVLVNPGGPGGSGVTLGLAMGSALQSLLDTSHRPSSIPKESEVKYFDIIGFDPRGVGFTEPEATCMPDGPSAWSWTLRRSTEGILDSSDAALGRLWSMKHVYGTSCKQALDNEDGPNIKQYMTTASVARDMLEIVEKHSEYVADHIKEKTLRENANINMAQCKEQKAVHHDSKPKLQYLGFSYGTYLGYTFSAMFPDRVGRVVLDGVVNSDDYDNSLSGHELHDNEKAMRSFYTFCILAGPEICPLAGSTSSVKDVEDRVHRIVQSLYHNPLQLPSPHGPEILTYSDVKTLIFGSLYAPYATFPFVAQILAAVEAGGGAVLEQLALGLQPQHIYQCPINGSIPLLTRKTVPTKAILCSDIKKLTNETIDEFKEEWQKLSKTSPTSGSIWALIRLSCTSWHIRAAHRYKGPFGAANTSHPILFVTNTADPVTPLRSAKIMQHRFPGSGLIVQDSAGHCAIAYPTPCTAKHVRTYFQTGALPPPKTFCVPEQSAFSLSSTHPESPFYDEELTRSVYGFTDADLAKFPRLLEDSNNLKAFEFEDDVQQLGAESWEAVQSLRGIAEDNVWWDVGAMERVRGMMRGLNGKEMFYD